MSVDGSGSDTALYALLAIPVVALIAAAVGFKMYHRRATAELVELADMGMPVFDDSKPNVTPAESVC